MWSYLEPKSAEATRQVVDEGLGLACERIGKLIKNADGFKPIGITALVTTGEVVERAVYDERPGDSRLVNNERKFLTAGRLASGL